MRKTFTLALAALLTAPAVLADPVIDFSPVKADIRFQEVIDNNTDALVSQVQVQATFPEDVYWISGVSQYCYVEDSEGNRVEYTPDFGGIDSDWSAFWFGVNGLDKYVDKDYTLVVPANLFGNKEWEDSEYTAGRTNPELRYDFNVWKLAGKPVHDNAAYDLECIIDELTTVPVGTNKEYKIVLRYPSPMMINEDIDIKTSIRDAEGAIVERATIKWAVDDADPCLVEARVRYLNFNSDIDYTLYIGKGSLGDTEWGESSYGEGRANPEMMLLLNPVNPQLPAYDFVPTPSDPICQQIDKDGASVWQVRIDVKFPSEVWWVSGVSRFCQLADNEGNPVEWTPDFSSPDADYTTFYFGINGLDIMTDKEYTLTVPAGAFGNATWNENNQTGNANPELSYTFNPWLLAGKPGGVATVTDACDADAPVYNLQGIRVTGTSLPAGIYIRGGKKFVVR